MAIKVTQKPQILYLVGNVTYIYGKTRLHRGGSLEVTSLDEKRRLLGLKNGLDKKIFSLDNPNEDEFEFEDDEEVLASAGENAVGSSGPSGKGKSQAKPAPQGTSSGTEV